MEVDETNPILDKEATVWIQFQVWVLFPYLQTLSIIFVSFSSFSDLTDVRRIRRWFEEFLSMTRIKWTLKNQIYTFNIDNNVLRILTQVIKKYIHVIVNRSFEWTLKLHVSLEFTEQIAIMALDRYFNIIRIIRIALSIYIPQSCLCFFTLKNNNFSHAGEI
jgi:hypothetical protein